MLNLFVYLFLLCLSSSVISLDCKNSVCFIDHNQIIFLVISLGNARIPTKLERVEIDQFYYDKLAKDTSKNITLQYQLNGADKSLDEEKISLYVNDKVEKVQISSVPIKGQKMFVDKAWANNSIVYSIRFSKPENVVTGKYVFEVKINGISYNATSYIECNFHTIFSHINEYAFQLSQ